MSLKLQNLSGRQPEAQLLLDLKNMVLDVMKCQGSIGIESLKSIQRICVNQRQNTISERQFVLFHLNIVIRLCFYAVLNEDSKLTLKTRDVAGAGDNAFLSAVLELMKNQPRDIINAKTLADFQTEVYTLMARTVQNNPSGQETSIQSKSFALAANNLPPVTAITSAKPLYIPLMAEPQVRADTADTADSTYVPMTVTSPEFHPRKSAELGDSYDSGSRILLPQVKRSSPYVAKVSEFKGTADVSKARQERAKVVTPGKFGQDQTSQSTQRAPSFQSNLNSLFPGVSASSLFRKNGMDFLSDDHLHDLVLACILIGVSVKAPSDYGNVMGTPMRTHKELVELIIDIHDRGLLGRNYTEILSKTKLRGVLGLLKNAKILDVHHLDDSGAPVKENDEASSKEVKLSLALHIDGFKKLRADHDAFVVEFLRSKKFERPIRSIQLLWSEPDIENKVRRISSFMKKILPKVSSLISFMEASPVTSVESERASTCGSAADFSDWEDIAQQLAQETISYSENATDMNKFDSMYPKLPSISPRSPNQGSSLCVRTETHQGHSFRNFGIYGSYVDDGSDTQGQGMLKYKEEMKDPLLHS